MKYLILTFLILNAFAADTDYTPQEKEMFLEDAKRYVSPETYRRLEQTKYFRRSDFPIIRTREEAIAYEEAHPATIEEFRKREQEVLRGEIEDFRNSRQIICDPASLQPSMEIYILTDFAEKLKVEAIKNAELVPCNSKLNDAISEDELTKIFYELQADTRFSNNHPNGECFPRAYVISKILNDKGFRSQQLTINGWINAAYKHGNYYGTEGYNIHRENFPKTSSGEENNQKNCEHK